MIKIIIPSLAHSVKTLAMSTIQLKFITAFTTMSYKAEVMRIS